MATSTEQIQQLYIALFGRPADAAGQSYWGNILATDPNAIPTIAATFAQSLEFAANYGGMPNTGVISAFYQNLFGHPPDATQLNQWSTQLGQGANIGTVVTGIINSAAAADAAVMNNKVIAATNFTAVLDTPAENNAYATALGRDTAQDYLAYVDDANSVTVATTPFSLNLVTSDIVAGTGWSMPARVAHQVQELYVAYFARAADRGGFDYWTALLDGDPANARLPLISGGFAASGEYKAEYSQATNAEKVNAVYENLFSREAEAAGRDFWVRALDAGQMTIDNAVTMIAAGAQGSDLYAYGAKVNVAEAITAAIDTPAEIQGYGTANGIAAVTGYIAQVRDVATFNAAIDPTAINTLVAGFAGQAAATPRVDADGIQLVGIANFESPGMMA